MPKPTHTNSSLNRNYQFQNIKSKRKLRQTIEQIKNKLIDYFKHRGDFFQAKSTGLSNPEIPIAYNPSAGFLEIRDYIHSETPFSSKKFFVNEKCFRVVDSNIVGVSKRHLSFFEMFAFFYAGSIITEDLEEELIKTTIDVLTNVLNLDKRKIIVTLFGGGNIVNISNIISEEDVIPIWVKYGIPKENIIKTSGLRNFVVNYQWGYAGTSYEIFYKIKRRLIEIGSTNKYKFKVKEKITTKDKIVYNLLPSKNFAYGTGFGIERLSMILNEKEDIFQIPELEEGIKFLSSFIPRDLKKISELDREHLKQITDGIRSILFIMDEGIRPSNKDSRGRILKDVIKNILEEINYLGLYDKSFEIIRDMIKLIRKQYIQQYELNTDLIIKFLEDYIKNVDIKKKYSHLLQVR